MKEMKRYYIIYKGQVQGVGFRWTLNLISQVYNITGFVKNLSDGSVMVEAQGEKNNLDAFLKDSLANLGYVEVEDYAIKEIDVVEHETVFEVKY